jgi:ferredoxin-type protein NapH
MTILFLSTVLLSGPAWCSYFCYFGALDNAAAQGRPDRKPIKNKWLWKYSLSGIGDIICFGIPAAWIFRLANADSGTGARVR